MDSILRYVFWYPGESSHPPARSDFPKVAENASAISDLWKAEKCISSLPFEQIENGDVVE